jgi:DNA primase
MKTARLTYDKEAIRARLPFPELVERELGEIPRDKKIACPFHAEKTPSFHIKEDRGHCFGCGADYDIFGLWQALRGCDFETALADLSAMVGLYGVEESASRPLPKPKPAPKRAEEEWVKPVVPPMRGLTNAEIRQLAETWITDTMATMEERASV